MAGPFGATTTTDDVLTGKDLRGKRVLVTGVSAGLGIETVRALAAHGAQVVGAARDLAKAGRATNEVRAQAANGGALSLWSWISPRSKACGPARTRWSPPVGLSTS
jgi:NAD(P)-dependent dehydrogenase (short-subunit alcohol dehydrogenase family)